MNSWPSLPEGREGQVAVFQFLIYFRCFFSSTVLLTRHPKELFRPKMAGASLLAHWILQAPDITIIQHSTSLITPGGFG